MKKTRWFHQLKEKVYDIKECILSGGKEHSSGTAKERYYKILCAKVLGSCFSQQIPATFREIKHRDFRNVENHSSSTTFITL